MKIKIIAQISWDFQFNLRAAGIFPKTKKKTHLSSFRVNAAAKTFSKEKNPQISPFLKIYSKSMRNKFPSIKYFFLSSSLLWVSVCIVTKHIVKRKCGENRWASYHLFRLYIYDLPYSNIYPKTKIFWATSYIWIVISSAELYYEKYLICTWY